MRIIPSRGVRPAAETSTGEIDRTHAARNAAFWWLALVPLFVLVSSLVSTLSPNDFWGHVAAGRWLAQNKQIPTTNLFSWGAPLDAPYPYPSWGAAWLMFAVLKTFGLTGIVALRAACAAATWAILIVVAWRRARRVAPEIGPIRAAQIVAFVALLAFGMAATNLDARPQMFALPLFALAVALLWELPHGWPHGVRSNSTVLVCIFIGTVLWANAHGSFFLSVAVPLGALCGEAIRKLSGKGSAFFGASLSAAKLKFLVAWTAVALLATCVNPRGVHVWDYIFSLNANRMVQQYIYEWQAPRVGEGAGTVFFGSAVLLVALAIVATCVKSENSRTQNEADNHVGNVVRVGEALILLALFVMGCRSLRSVLWFALVFVPVASAVGAAYFASKGSTVEFDRTARNHFGIKAMCAALFFGAIGLWPPLKSRLPLPQSFRARYAPSPSGEIPFILDNTTPVEAAEFLRRNPPRRLWNDMGQGAFLAYALPPGTARCDWRIELFPAVFWLDYLRLSQGPPDAAAQLEKMKISDVLCDRDAQRGLVARLRRSRVWHERGFANSIIFTKKST